MESMCVKERDLVHGLRERKREIANEKEREKVCNGFYVCERWVQRERAIANDKDREKKCAVESMCVKDGLREREIANEKESV